ncbi:MAG: two-component system histidine kinase [Microbacterium sp.]|jgi:signal transduction histidine kinase|nr:two-component system histidine kinase [Microbacterium sp.]
MWLRRPSHADAVLAALCGLTVAVNLLPATMWGLPAAAVVAGLILVMPQRPLTAGALLAAVYVTLSVTGLTLGNAAWLTPLFVGVYSLGRYAPLWRGGFVALVVAVASLEIWTPQAIAFSVVLTGCLFAYGRVVQLRAQRARRARASETELQAADAAAVAARIVADERARLGGQSLTLLRAAVEGMRSDAASARVELDGRLIESVCERGRLAVTELRWLLGILRSESVPDRPKKARDLRGRVVNIVVAAALLVLCVWELWNQVWEPPTPLAWALAVALPVCVLARRRFTTLACSAAAAGVATALLTGILPTVGNLFCMVLLAWSAGSARSPVVWGIFGALAAGTAVWGARHDPANWEFTLALLALPAFAGFEWSAHDRVARAASAHADELRAELDARVESALREERLRIARELHDVTSHAVGVMVMQASAASALRERDPAAARSALKTVDEAAAQTLEELDMMLQLLDSGAIGGPGLASATAEPLQTLVDRMRRTGLDISLEQAVIPVHLCGVVYRIVQESLTNVVRHSNARHVRISMARDEGRLCVRVVDDGTRIPDEPAPGEETPGFGLTGLGERVNSAGGAFRAGWDTQGFTVEASLLIEPVKM